MTAEGTSPDACGATKTNGFSVHCGTPHSPSCATSREGPGRVFPFPTGAQHHRAEEVEPNTRLPLLTRPKIWCDCVNTRAKEIRSPLTPPLLERKGHQNFGGLGHFRDGNLPRLHVKKARPIILTTGSQSASLIQVNNRLECTAGHSERPLIMPTDLDAPVAARKREAQAKTRTLVTTTLIWVIISLALFWLLLKVV
jgi:hypothetical protein